MSWSTPEKDWKYIRSIRNDLLEVLCRRINQQSAAILKDSFASEHDKYLALYRHLQESDQIIAECFNALKRSNLMMKLAALQYYRVLAAEHVERLSSETQKRLNSLKTLNNP